MSDPFPLSLSYCIYQCSFVSNHCLVLLNMWFVQSNWVFPLFPIFTFRRPPVFYIILSHSPCLIYRAGHYTSVFLPLIFVIRDFSISGILSSLGMPIIPIAILLLISLLNLASVVIVLPRYSRICSYYYIISFHPVCILTAVSFPLLIFNAFLFLTNIFIPCSFSVLVIVCSVDLWILAIVAWSSNHPSNLNALINLPPAFSRYPTAWLTSYSM